jgi:hypothetical protein
MPGISAPPKMRLVIMGLALLLSIMAGCGGLHHEIVGKWRADGPTAMVWQFNTDGSVLMGSARGQYSVGDSDRVKIETRFSTLVYHMEFPGNRLILKDPNGSKLEFTRVK